MNSREHFINGKDFSAEAVDSLLKMAADAAENSYSPYSHFRVGSALLTESGKVFTGTNVENASYGGTICAERAAVSAAVSGGHRDIAAIAVVSPDGDAWPCGICRQVLMEFGSDIKVIVGLKDRPARVMDVAELLPEGFRL